MEAETSFVWNLVSTNEWRGAEDLSIPFGKFKVGSSSAAGGIGSGPGRVGVNSCPDSIDLTEILYHFQ